MCGWDPTVQTHWIYRPTAALFNYSIRLLQRNWLQIHCWKHSGDSGVWTLHQLKFLTSKLWEKLKNWEILFRLLKLDFKMKEPFYFILYSIFQFISIFSIFLCCWILFPIGLLPHIRNYYQKVKKKLFQKVKTPKQILFQGHKCPSRDPDGSQATT